MTALKEENANMKMKLEEVGQESTNCPYTETSKTSCNIPSGYYEFNKIK